MKKLLFLFTFIFVISIGVSAQTDDSKQINGGILNGKAVYLARPAFPAAARAVKASGTVIVQVLIDEQGNVVSAVALNGHPLLHTAALKAARDSKFSTTFLQGQPIKVSGIITYNFVDSNNLKTYSDIGFDLGLLEKSKEFPDNVSIPNLSYSLPEDWKEEHEKIKEYYAPITKQQIQTDSKKERMSIKTVPDIALNTTENRARLKSEDRGSVSSAPLTGIRVVSEDSPKRKEISAELIEKIENRLASNETNLWKFRVGTILGRISAQDDPANIKSESAPLNSLIASAPNGMSAHTLNGLRKLMEIIQKSDASSSDIKELAKSLKTF